MSTVHFLGARWIPIANICACLLARALTIASVDVAVVPQPMNSAPLRTRHDIIASSGSTRCWNETSIRAVTCHASPVALNSQREMPWTRPL